MWLEGGEHGRGKATRSEASESGGARPWAWWTTVGLIQRALGGQDDEGLYGRKVPWLTVGNSVWEAAWTRVADGLGGAVRG